MTHAKNISLERGSGLLRRAQQDTPLKTAQETTQIVSDFVNRNEQGSLRVFVAGGSRAGTDKAYVKEAFKLGETIGKMNYRLDFGLSSRGIMGAVAKGVMKTWADGDGTDKSPIYGVTTKEYLALYQSDSLLEEVSKIIVADTLEERKQQLLAADFVIFAPGGVGTLDELVYDCVAMQDGFLDFKPFVLFNVNGFFHHLLEYLKEINLKGFSDPMPFLVVDNCAEAAVVFCVLSHYFNHKVTSENGRALIEKIIYELPYIIETVEVTKDSVEKILLDMAQIRMSKNKMQIRRLKMDIKNAYLNKETIRMYERLSKTGMDIATVSKKLSHLKKGYINK